MIKTEVLAQFLKDVMLHYATYNSELDLKENKKYKFSLDISIEGGKLYGEYGTILEKKTGGNNELD